MDEFNIVDKITAVVSFGFIILAGISAVYVSYRDSRNLQQIRVAIDELNRKIEEYEDEDEDESDSDSESDTDSEPEPCRFFTFEFVNGSYAHYFEDPNGAFTLVLPEDTVRGDVVIEATVGHVTRANPHGSPIITYIDIYGSGQTYVLPEYAGRKFCAFINSKL